MSGTKSTFNATLKSFADLQLTDELLGNDYEADGVTIKNTMRVQLLDVFRRGIVILDAPLATVNTTNTVSVAGPILGQTTDDELVVKFSQTVGVDGWIGLANITDLNDKASIIPLGVADPTVVGVSAVIGTFGYTNETIKRWFLKVDSSDTDWHLIGSEYVLRDIVARIVQPKRNPLNLLESSDFRPDRQNQNLEIVGATFGEIRNLAQHSYDPPVSGTYANFYNPEGSTAWVTIGDGVNDYIDVPVDGQLIRMYRLEQNGFTNRLSTRQWQTAHNWLTVGKKFLVSCYVIRLSEDDDDVAEDVRDWIFQRDGILDGFDDGSEKRYTDRQIRRPTTLIKAVTINDKIVWLQSAGSAVSRTAKYYVGGFQVEMIEDNAKDFGIWTGDSTQIHSSQGQNAFDDGSVSSWTEALIGSSGRAIKIQNEARGGEWTSGLLGYYVDDILPKQQDERSFFLVVQGGLNNISNGDTLADMQSDFNEFKARAESVASIAFTSGGTYEILAGDTITGATSTETAVVKSVHLESGTWAGGDAAGTLFLETPSGTFQAENLNVDANTNVATIAGDSTAHNALQIVVCTCTGNVNDGNLWDATQKQLQQDLNEWLRYNFIHVLDLEAWNADYIDPTVNNLQSDLVGDAVHYEERQMRYLGERCAEQLMAWFDFPKATPYQRRTGLTTIARNQLVLNQEPQPNEPEIDTAIMWLSDGTGHGDAGDVMIGSNNGGTTTYATVFDQSTGAAW